jgi:tight adherence protein B
VSRTARFAACTAILAAVLAPSAHASDARLSPAGGTFPVRSFVLTLPTSAAADPAAVQVTENGQQVQRLSVRPATSRFAVLLLVDASTSMRGEAIRGAMAAARAFAQQRPAAQPLGVLTFNVAPQVLIKPTTDGNTISAALKPRPALARGTHIYDALAAALKEIDPSRYDAAAVVILSDGHDYGSTATAGQIASAARAAHARLFTVGLRSGLFDPKTLEEIAASGNGEYLGAASPRALAAIYRSLGNQLANAYTIRYLSSAASGAAVEVAADTGTERASAEYTAPNVRVDGELPPSTPLSGTHDESFLSSKAGAAIIALAVLLLVLGGTSLPLQQQARRAALRRRVGAYGTAPEHEDIGAPERRRPQGARAERLAEALELGRMEITLRRFLLYTAGGTLMLALFAAAVLDSGFLVVAALLAGPLAARAIVRRNVARQRHLFADQLADSIQAVTSAMRTGNSFVGALSQLVEHAPEPSASEFRRVVADERLGVPLDTALVGIVDRMDNRDLHQVGLVSVIQRETGGNGAEALDRVVGNIRARDDIRRLVRTLTAQGRMSQSVLTALPVITAVALKLLGGEAMDPLFKTGYGHALLIVCGCMVAAGGLWIGRIVKVKV